jgi:hypothetical protein
MGGKMKKTKNESAATGLAPEKRAGVGAAATVLVSTALVAVLLRPQALIDWAQDKEGWPMALRSGVVTLGEHLLPLSSQLGLESFHAEIRLFAHDFFGDDSVPGTVGVDPPLPR